MFLEGDDSPDLLNINANADLKVTTPTSETEDETATKMHQNTFILNEKEGEEEENEEEEGATENPSNSKITSELVDIANKQRQRLTAEFDKLKLSTMKEMERSKQMLASLKTLKGVEARESLEDKGKDKDESELDATIKTLEESIDRFDQQIK